ncbi:hypothetical protein [Streptomyces sp. SID8352]|uniref:hypothetical protein n=1 Tax=Streptomyces sp. SID8352 TaxID=2690338 RepID=UPI0013720672|nr:hypothetical protein [Streptomyces sp. SID8352]MYU23724.1 hypothetical protein [Streptomyces sp. SID8352]
MTDFPGVYQWPTYFHEANDSAVLSQQQGLLSLPVGTGVLLRGDRYRVVDSWFSYDHHGVFNDGLHIFLEPVAEEDDRLQHLAPDYFRDDLDA